MMISGYDNWKLASPHYSDMVSSCCGSEYEDYSNYSEEDIEEIFPDYLDYSFSCTECKEGCEIIDEDEYKFNRHESYLEDLADEKRQGL